MPLVRRRQYVVECGGVGSRDERGKFVSAHINNTTQVRHLSQDGSTIIYNVHSTIEEPKASPYM